jgi:hypothetical protein
MLEVTIIPEDFRAAPKGYVGPECVLKEALRRLFPRKNAFVGFRYVNLEGDKYLINTGEWGQGNLPDGFSAHAINEYSAQAKVNLDGIPSKTLYLQPLSQ